MKRKQFHTAVIGLIIAVHCFVVSPSLFADSDPSSTQNPAGDTPTVNLTIATETTVEKVGVALSNNSDLGLSGAAEDADACWRGYFDRRAIFLPRYDPTTDSWIYGEHMNQSGPPQGSGFEPGVSPQMKNQTSISGKGDFPFEPLFVPDDLYEMSNQPKNEKDETSELNLIITDILQFMKDYQKELQKLFSLGDDEESGQLADKLDFEWEAKINALILELQNQKGIPQDETSEVMVLDAIDFTQQVKAIHRLLNPPRRLHPWLKWLLYLNRVSPEMLQFYQAALEGRDRIFTLAMKSNGKLKIRYQGRVMNVPFFVWPDEAEGAYELVLVRDRHTPVGSNSALPSVATQAPQ